MSRGSESVRDASPTATPPRSTTCTVAFERLRVALDPVPGEPGDLLDGGVERHERAQRAVAQPVARRARGERRRDQRHVEQRLVGARDPDRDRLGLVLDRVDRAGELLDPARERGGEVLHDGARRADLAVLELVRVERADAGGVPQQRGDRDAGARLERAVVAAGTQRPRGTAGPGPRSRARGG